MKRLALLAMLPALALASVARADVFEVVPTPASFAAASFSTPPAVPVQLSYPQLLGLWQQAGSQYGVPWQLLAAINKVESNFGRNMGPSSAGAIGWMQFMPATWLRWGVDANADGVADPWNPTDAIFSAARYLAAAGAPSNLYRAVYAYNHADWYVHEVLGLANLYAGDGTLAFSLDRLQQNLDEARHAVVLAGERLDAANFALRRWHARESRAALLSARLALEPRTALAAIRRDAAAKTLAAARRALSRAQQQSAAAAFAPAASNLLAGPLYASGYVFPVGGGPGVVFASHTHHDYPAVDIAAPLGSPAYALADSVVLRAWSVSDPVCGVGLTLHASDGQTWTYCHLAVLDPGIVAGAALSAGQEVGLVGATGDATGPHLHLQLEPADAWPQQEPWFESFAGTGFSWSDAPVQPAVRTLAVFSTAQAASPRSGRVFAVVPAAGIVLFSRP